MLGNIFLFLIVGCFGFLAYMSIKEELALKELNRDSESNKL